MCTTLQVAVLVEGFQGLGPGFRGSGLMVDKSPSEANQNVPAASFKTLSARMQYAASTTR